MRTPSPGVCPACGSAAERFAASHSLCLERCRSCSLVYLDPPPTAAAFDRFVNDYDVAAHFEPWQRRKRVLFERRLAHLGRPAAGRHRLLDVGCGDGQFMALAAEWGWHCTGVELNPPAAARTRERGFEVREGDFIEMELPAGEYNVVTAWDSLEHVPDARAFVRRLVGSARLGGLIAASTVNIESLAYRVFGTQWSMIHEDHFTYWDRRALAHVFERAGCEIVAESSFGLGRDFVTALDRVEALLRRNRRARERRNRARPAVADNRPVPRRWDVNPLVLVAEQLVNRALSVTSRGVDIMCVARRL